MNSPRNPPDKLAQLGSALGVDVIRATPPQTTPSDVAAERGERDRHEVERLELDNARIQSELDDLKQDRDERLKYASRAYLLLVGWLAVVVLTVVATGLPTLNFKLSDGVLLMLLGTSSTGVISIFLIVANYLFPKASRAKS